MTMPVFPKLQKVRHQVIRREDEQRRVNPRSLKYLDHQIPSPKYLLAHRANAAFLCLQIAHLRQLHRRHSQWSQPSAAA